MLELVVEGEAETAAVLEWEAAIAESAGKKELRRVLVAVRAGERPIEP